MLENLRISLPKASKKGRKRKNRLIDLNKDKKQKHHSLPLKADNPTELRLLHLFHQLHHALLKPVLSPRRTLRRDLFEDLLNDVPGIDSRYILDLIEPGPKLKTTIDFPGIDRNDQEIYEGAKAVAILKEFLDHYYMKKFLGPFPF